MSLFYSNPFSSSLFPSEWKLKSSNGLPSPATSVLAILASLNIRGMLPSAMLCTSGFYLHVILVTDYISHFKLDSHIPIPYLPSLLYFSPWHSPPFNILHISPCCYCLLPLNRLTVGIYKFCSLLHCQWLKPLDMAKTYNLSQMDKSVNLIS